MNIHRPFCRPPYSTETDPHCPARSALARRSRGRYFCLGPAAKLSLGHWRWPSLMLPTKLETGRAASACAGGFPLQPEDFRWADLYMAAEADVKGKGQIILSYYYKLITDIAP